LQNGKLPCLLRRKIELQAYRAFHYCGVYIRQQRFFVKIEKAQFLPRLKSGGSLRESYEFDFFEGTKSTYSKCFS